MTLGNQFRLQIKHEHIVKRHVMPVSTKHYQAIIIYKASVTISCGRSPSRYFSIEMYSLMMTNCLREVRLVDSSHK